MRWLFLSILTLYLKQCSGQTVQPELITPLPDIVDESSGLIADGHHHFWTINDSGGEPIIYGFDDQGNLIDTVRITGAINKDWEALAFDKAGQRLFIGDFGNNGQARKDLTVYWMEWRNDSIAGSVNAFTFHYPDQTQFPAADNFDAEALLYWEDSLYLFSKNRTLGAQGYSKLYRLAIDTGHQAAVLVDSILTQFPITGATINPAGDAIALLSYGSIMLLDVIPGKPFTSGHLTRIGIPFSQTEAIDFVGNDTLYYTDEQGSLYRILRATIVGNRDLERVPFSLHPNPAKQQVTVRAEGYTKKEKLTVFSTRGTIQHKANVQQWPLILDVAQWPSGTYFLQINSDGRLYTLPFQKL